MSKTVIAGLAGGAATPRLLAQEAATPAPARTEAKAPRIAVIDMARVSSESLLGKGYAAQLEAIKNEIDAEGTKKQSELQKMDAAVKALQDELDKQGSVLSTEAVAKKRQEIVKKTRDQTDCLAEGQDQ